MLGLRLKREGVQMGGIGLLGEEVEGWAWWWGVARRGGVVRRDTRVSRAGSLLGC